MKQTKKIYWADKLGIMSTLTCMIHCLAAPTLLAMGISFLYNPIISISFIIVAIISIYKTTKGKFIERNSLFLWLSLTGFITSALLEERSVLFEYGIYIFSTLIIVGHFYNIKNSLKF